MTIIAQRYSKEGVLRKLFEATSGGDMWFDERVSQLFSLGHKVLGLRVGILSRIEGNDYDLVGVSCPPEMDMSIGMRFELCDTYCCKVVEAEEPIGFAAAHGGQWADHPCYEKFGLESYLGVPVIVHGQVYGTLNFSDPEARSTEFTGFEGDLIGLMARWIGGQLERQQQEQTYQRRHRELRDSTCSAVQDLQEPLRQLIAHSGKLDQVLGAETNKSLRQDLDLIVNAGERLQVLVDALLVHASK